MVEQVGRYNRKITIMQRSAARDAAGEPIVGDWAPYKTLWSMIRGRNGMAWIREIGVANGTIANASMDLESFRVAFREDITTDMCVQYRGMRYDILLVRLDTADRQFADIIVRTGASDG